MKLSAVLASPLLVLVEGGRRHPSVPGLIIDPIFHGHLKCPYAGDWIAKGPEAAARDLGLAVGGGRALAGGPVRGAARGSCSYSNAWSGPTCLQFEGEGWTDEDARARCAEENDSVYGAEGCANAAGWCVVAKGDDRSEATAMALSAGSDCDGMRMPCESFMGGTFVADGDCLAGPSPDEETGGGNQESEDAGGPPPGVMAGGPPPGVMAGGAGYPGAVAASGDASAMTCLIAPGAIGAAHQAGFSKGYSASCPDTPAQESPYMWPMRWAADTETQNMAFGSDDVVYTSRGRTFYMLDRNWKRSDTTYQYGTLRTIGQGPCEDGLTDFGCEKNETDMMSTMIHREGLMYFISWKEDENNKAQVGETDPSKIEGCTMIDLAIIGNIRPDWFLDKRGDDTDVQYLGDQHVYYEGAVPKLVKQWRKKDFASQYFTMSMMGNPPNKLEQKAGAPVEDDMHWPLILNIPGEGFGDDMLQSYRNHALLTDDDAKLFEIIEAYEAIGGKCVDTRAMDGEGGGAVGPPIMEEHIPSNLEVDPLSWVSNEITFSPIWTAPVNEAKETTAMAAASGQEAPAMSVVEVSDQLTVESCYDESTSSFDMSFHFRGIEPSSDGLLPWMAIGYRDRGDICSMTPIEGGNTPIVLVTQGEEGAAPAAHKTMLFPEAKAVSQEAFIGMYAGMVPLEQEVDFADVSVEMSSADVQMARAVTLTEEDIITLRFKHAAGVGPGEAMNLMYAIGMTSRLGVHTRRGCFELTQHAPCPAETDGLGIDLGGAKDDGVVEAESGAASGAESSAIAPAGGWVLWAVVAAVVVVIGFALFIGIARGNNAGRAGQEAGNEAKQDMGSTTRSTYHGPAESDGSDSA